jgi:hypothetical protein
MAPKVAEALRRIQPEMLPVPQLGKDWALCQIGGQQIPIRVQEIPAVYRQVQQLVGRGLTAAPISVMSQSSRAMDGLLPEQVHAEGA